MKLIANLFLALILISIVSPITAYPEDFFEFSGAGYQPPVYKEPYTGKLSFAGEQMTDCMRVVLFGDPATDIPAGFTHDDANFLNMYVQGASTAGGTGGSPNGHSHTSDDANHTHTGNPTHDHSVTRSQITCPDTITRNFDVGGSTVASNVHGHSPDPDLADVDQNFQGANPTTGDTNALPRFVTALFIGPDTGTTADVPVGGVVFSDGFSSTDFTIVDGSGTAPDLDGNFLRGTVLATDSSSEVGGTIFGDHGHTYDLNHVHSGTPHIHSEFQTGSAATFTKRSQSDLGGANIPSITHHEIRTATNDQSDVNGIKPIVDDNAFEPEHIFMYGLENTGASAATPDGIYVIWLCNSADVPTGWEIADSDENTFDLSAVQLKFTTDSTKVGDLNGSNSAGHSTTSHFHGSFDSHDHDDSVGSVLSFFFAAAAGPSTYCTGAKNHTHQPNPVQNVFVTTGSTTYNTDATDSRAEFRNVIFIKKVVTDTCTYIGSGDFVVSCADSCVIIADVDLGGNDLILINDGLFHLQAILRRVAQIQMPATPDSCDLVIFSNGGFDFET